MALVNPWGSAAGPSKLSNCFLGFHLVRHPAAGPFQPSTHAVLHLLFRMPDR